MQQRSGIEKYRKIGKSRIADIGTICYAYVMPGWGTGWFESGRLFMADLGIARVNRDDDLSGTLTRADLCDVVHRKLGLSRAESASFVERVLHHMCHALSEGANVKISGFGSFILRDKGQRIGRNPKTGVEVPIAPRRVMTFRASQILRDRIAK